MAPKATTPAQTGETNGSIALPPIAKEDNMAVKIETLDEMIAANLRFAKKCKEAGVEGFLEVAMHTLISLLRANVLNPTQKRQVSAQILAMKKNYDTENNRPFDLAAAFGAAQSPGAPTVQ